MTNVILCGGNGTRLWPISREDMPKQFTKLIGENSLFQQTLQRNNKLTDKFLVVCNVEHYFLALDQIGEIKDELSKAINIKFILEPVGKNTAAAITLSSLYADTNEILFVTPSDHAIDFSREYNDAVNEAIKNAKDDKLSLFGIKPTYAETGYGYVEYDKSEIKSFHEKPNEKTAQKYLEAGNFYWNSGMFCFKAKVLLDEVKKYALDIYESCHDAFIRANKNDIFRIKKEDMQEIPLNSIDFAVMEKTHSLKLVKADFKWNDLGSFDAIYSELADENENAISYKDEEPILVNSKGNLVISESKKVSLVGMDDVIVIDTSDALLIAKKGESQNVKEVVNRLKKEGSSLTSTHPLVHRPWGSYNLLEHKRNYKLKTIVVKPDRRLSLQKHLHRNEHWVVLSGTATVTIGKEKKLIRTNESVYIPMGTKHRLSNDGKMDLVLIEAQVGDYLEEDDIIRYKDDYKR